jgi:membrane associated rhomboid family serine protease
VNGIPLPFVRTNQWFLVITVALALLLNQPWILAVSWALGVYSLISGKNPLFFLVRPLLSKSPSAYPMEDPAQQRFNQWISVLCLSLSLLGFLAGWPVVGLLFALMVGVAALTAILGFCIGCFIRYRYLRWRQQRLKS